MTVIEFPQDDILALAGHLLDAHNGIQEVVDGLEKTVCAVEPKWHGDSRQAFARFYREWRKGVDTHSIALKKTAEQLRKMAEAHQQFI